MVPGRAVRVRSGGALEVTPSERKIQYVRHDEPTRNTKPLLPSRRRHNTQGSHPLQTIASIGVLIGAQFKRPNLAQVKPPEDRLQQPIRRRRLQSLQLYGQRFAKPAIELLQAFADDQFNRRSDRGALG